jgi:hypothetical protein
MSTRGQGRGAGVGVVVGAALVAMALTGGTASAEEWLVKSVPRTDGPGTRCVMESVRRSLFDGYQDTTAYVTVDARSVTVTSASNLDPTFSDIGLFVDEEPFIPMDRLAGTKSAEFTAKYGRLIDLFKAGVRLRVQFRFWKEWPTTGTHSVTFSLIGFTKAYGELAACR